MPTPDFIIALQQRIVAGEEVSAEELNAAVEQIRTERAHQVASGAKSSTRSSSPTKPAPMNLAAFLLDRGILPKEPQQ